jgi:hypothetical protein
MMVERTRRRHTPMPREMIVVCGLVAMLSTVVSGHAMPPSKGMSQRSVLSEKDSRTPAQRKINSQLLYEIYRRRGEATQKDVPPGKTGVKIDRRGRALVDVRVEVTPALQKKVGSLGGTIVSMSVEYRSIIAWVPLLKLERLAEDRAVHAIEPRAEATTVR